MKSLECPVHKTKYQKDTFRCSACDHQHHGERVGRRARVKRDNPLQYNHDAAITVPKDKTGRIRPGALAELLTAMGKDPARLAMLEAASRRPAGVSKERFQIAIRASVQEPMLTAHKRSVEKGLDFKHLDESNRKSRVPKGPVYAKLVVRPLALRNAKHGRTSPFWGERLWYVRTLKYASGYVITTDIGDDSRTFPTFGELKSAITKSGWEVVRHA